MPLPRPTPGLVIHYEYLWRYEVDNGNESGDKVRPCALVIAVSSVSGDITTVVAPITHRILTPPSEGIEIPRRVKQSLGLDQHRSWIIVTDLNEFIWPGLDIYPVPNSPPGTFDYGFLPPLLFDQIRSRILEIGALSSATIRDR